MCAAPRAAILRYARSMPADPDATSLACLIAGLVALPLAAALGYAVSEWRHRKREASRAEFVRARLDHAHSVERGAARFAADAIETWRAVRAALSAETKRRTL